MATPRSASATGSERLVKSKERVRDLAEVYTASREVKAMLDLIPGVEVSGGIRGIPPKQTFLEPACGNGNFLVEILRRKLLTDPRTRPYFDHGDGRPRTTPAPYPKAGAAEEIVLAAIEAVASMYGFDICPNNIAETRARLYAFVLYGEDLLLPGFLTGADTHTQAYIEEVTPDHVLVLASDYETRLFRFADRMAHQRRTHERADTVSPLLRDTLKLVLARNFQQGDFLAQTDAAGQPLTVGRWTFLSGKVAREDFLLADTGDDNAKPVSALSLRSLTRFVKGAGHV